MSRERNNLVNKSRKVFLITPLLILLIIVFLGGCDAMNNAQSKIYKDEKAQLKQGDSYTFGNKLGEIQDGKTNISFTGFTGLYSLWDVTSSVEQTVTLKITGSIQKGDFKIIAVTPDHKIIKIWEDEGDSDISLQVHPGTTVIKWVGKRASGKLNLELAPQTGIQSKARSDLFEDWDWSK